MGRKIQKVKPAEQKIEWVFKINFDLNLTNEQARIAFLSGVERSYYPEDPGFSKFGLVYQLNLEGDVPPCNYTPPSFALTKPVSKKGYSIDGLSAPRFPKVNKHLDYPPPDKYQAELTDALLNSSRKPIPPAEDFFRLPPTDPFVLKHKEVLANQRTRQCYVGFGSLKTMPRFGKTPTFNSAGVGSYNLMPKQPPRPHLNSSFGRSPMICHPSTEIRCTYLTAEKCIECGKDLEICDHYRTRFSVRVPLPETRNPLDVGNDFPRGVRHVNLCNVCFYRAIQGHSKNWPKNKVRWLFKKVRTCANIHEHHNLPEIIHRADCKTVRKLQRKEAILSKYYADRVEESLPAKVTTVNDNL
ncbi:hypothetical protein Ocin01_05384 [Orchesella cincta]|uniref:Uncharacterized protein n=1 Tax=Orchesella cincta TaxID=48709 RepID=A0A1D2N7Q8_ORCCI|nr:hypothetical protein Ocin01_05384 [Orchesella cincta]